MNKTISKVIDDLVKHIKNEESLDDFKIYFLAKQNLNTFSTPIIGNLVTIATLVTRIVYKTLGKAYTQSTLREPTVDHISILKLITEKTSHQIRPINDTTTNLVNLCLARNPDISESDLRKLLLISAQNDNPYIFNTIRDIYYLNYHEINRETLLNCLKKAKNRSILYLADNYEVDLTIEEVESILRANIYFGESDYNLSWLIKKCPEKISFDLFRDTLESAVFLDYQDIVKIILDEYPDELTLNDDSSPLKSLLADCSSYGKRSNIFEMLLAKCERTDLNFIFKLLERTTYKNIIEALIKKLISFSKASSVPRNLAYILLVEFQQYLLYPLNTKPSLEPIFTQIITENSISIKGFLEGFQKLIENTFKDCQFIVEAINSNREISDKMKKLMDHENTLNDAIKKVYLIEILDFVEKTTINKARSRLPNNTKPKKNSIFSCCS